MASAWPASSSTGWAAPATPSTGTSSSSRPTAIRCSPPVRLRAAIPEAAAQSLPIHGLGARAGAAEAAAEFDAVLAAIFPDLVAAVVDDDAPATDDRVEVEVDEAPVGIDGSAVEVTGSGLEVGAAPVDPRRDPVQAVGSTADAGGWQA